MSNAKEWKIAIQQAAGTFNKDIVEILVCTVDSVDTNARTCDCTAITGDANVEIAGVQLMAEVSDGILLTPSVGSTVIVGKTTRNIAFVIMYSDLDSITMLGGDLGGLVKVVELTQKLNAIENKLNTIITEFTAHVHTGGTISGSTGPTTVSFLPELTPTERSDIENINILQG